MILGSTETVTSSTAKSILYGLSYELHCLYFFLWVYGERFLPLPKYTHRSLLQAPAYLAHTSTVSPYRETSQVPNQNCLRFWYDEASEWYLSVRFLQLRVNLRLLLSYT